MLKVIQAFISIALLVHTKKMRPKIGILDSKPLLRILLLISQGDNYGQRISIGLNSDPSLVVRNLKTLEKHKFLISQREKLLNKKIYSVDYSRIADEYIKYVYDTAKENKEFLINYSKEMAGSTNVHQYKNYGFTELSMRISQIDKYFKRLKSNSEFYQGLSILFEAIFKYGAKHLTNERTMREIFSYSTITISPFTFGLKLDRIPKDISQEKKDEVIFWL